MLANVVRKPMQQIFSEFTGIKSGDQASFTGTGDVKYHLGTSYDRPTITGKRVHLSLLANPSHLEVSNLLLCNQALQLSFVDVTLQPTFVCNVTFGQQLTSTHQPLNLHCTASTHK